MATKKATKKASAKRTSNKESEEEPEESQVEETATKTKTTQKTPTSSNQRKKKRTPATQVSTEASESENESPAKESPPRRSKSVAKAREQSANSNSDSDEESDEDDIEVEAPKQSTAKVTTSAKVVQNLEDRLAKESTMTTKQIKALKKQLKESEEAHYKDVEDYNDLYKQHEHLLKVHDELKEKYRDLLSSTAGKRKKVDKNKGMLQQIGNTVKRILWRTVKFVGSDEQLLVVATKCLDYLNMRSYTHVRGESAIQEANIDRARDEWLAIYSTDVRAAVNEQRSYVQAEQKKFALLWQKGSDKLDLPPRDLPTVEKMWEIVTRNVEVEDDEKATNDNMDLFLWWLDHVGAVAGNTYYPKKIRRTQEVSVAINSADDKLCVPPSTEAMAFLIYENCYQKWIEMHKWKEIEKNAGDVPKYSKGNPKTHRFQAKYSDSCSGQSPYGGWGSDGLKRFNTIKAAIAKMREEEPDRIAIVESDAVKLLHDQAVAERKKKLEENGQEVPTDEDAILPKKKRSRKTNSSAEVVLAEMDED